MSEQLLDYAEVGLFHKAGCESMTEHVGSNFTAESLETGVLNLALDLADGDMLMRVDVVESETVITVRVILPKVLVHEFD